MVRRAARAACLGQHRLLLQYELSVSRDARTELGGQGNGLVERVGVQTLGAAKHSRHGLDRRADDVVVRLLQGYRTAQMVPLR